MPLISSQVNKQSKFIKLFIYCSTFNVLYLYFQSVFLISFSNYNTKFSESLSGWSMKVPNMLSRLPIKRKCLEDRFRSWWMNSIYLCLLLGQAAHTDQTLMIRGVGFREGNHSHKNLTSSSYVHHSTLCPLISWHFCVHQER